MSKLYPSKYFEINVTQEVINNSERKNSGHCMIADGLKESIPRSGRVMVDLQTIRWTDLDTGVRYVALTPVKGQRALLKFDEGIETEPFNLRVYPFQVIEPGPGRSGGQRKRSRTAVVTEKKRGKGDGGNGRTVIIDGAPPPSGALSNRGQRRQWGIRVGGSGE